MNLKNQVRDNQKNQCVATSKKMNQIEERADAAGLSYYKMMENAGVGAAEQITNRHAMSGKRVVVFCGKGNNGGDGFVVARKLTEQGASVFIFLVGDESKTEDGNRNLQICETMGIPIVSFNDPEIELAVVEEADILIDAIYGTGFHGNLNEVAKKATDLINRQEAFVYSLDIPSGLNGDSGEADPATVKANMTVVFHALKPAHVKKENVAYCGDIVCISIGIENVLDEEILEES